MKRMARLPSLPWHARLLPPDANRPASQRSAAPGAASRPGIAPRWKPRARVNATGT
jgi:hypothetical protein